MVMVPSQLSLCKCLCGFLTQTPVHSFRMVLENLKKLQEEINRESMLENETPLLSIGAPSIQPTLTSHAPILHCIQESAVLPPAGLCNC